MTYIKAYKFGICPDKKRQYRIDERPALARNDAHREAPAFRAERRPLRW
ncbi:MAG: hypothetical protein M1321_02190 [Candidatus Marsarchaeota archaeon]|jgi:hypothetical protein|nr:hypothetical protein [Candidatus Marsarchaeota archaeon]